MKICPKCNYERTVQDNLLFPDYECPSCGIIFEKDKAKQELAELEKQREKQRKAKQAKLKKEEAERLKKEERERKEKEEAERARQEEEERERKEEQERLKREEQERKEREEAARLQELEAERVRREKEERKRKEEQRRQEREEQERKEKEEAARLQELETERVRREDEERKEEQERLQKEAEKEKQLAEEENKRQEKDAKIILKERHEKIEQILQENPDRIISPAETEKTYQLFDMCPFGMAQTGKGLSIVGFGETKNKWQHARCMQKYCRLWTWKTDKKGVIYAQGCSLQFLGLSKEEIEKNFSIKNTELLEDNYPLHDTQSPPESQE